MGLQKEIKSAISAGHGTAVVYAATLGLLISDIVPTPADSLYFALEYKHKKDLEDGRISAKKYWILTTLEYYGLNPLWWALVLGAVVVTKGSYSQKAKIGIGIIGAGAVVAVISKNIQKDTLRYAKKG